MRYLKLVWHHESTDDPQVIWTEIDDNDIEIRKIEHYADGRLGLAGGGQSNGSTELGLWSVPPLEEIKKSPEFSPKEISPADFENEWRQAVSEKRRLNAARRPRVRSNRSKIRVRSTTGSLSRFLDVTPTTTGWDVRTNRGKKIATAPTREKAMKLARDILLSTKKKKSSAGSRIQDPHKTPTRNSERQSKK
ncbi:DUF6881 domain-containing protein [Streptomyces sp. NPDC051815]|uniref:DUF6881 domain-containing protein n=1 Tax=Streptomyces sp. NPDC051815 TaxID=3365674 RepID=UPI0037BB1793